MKKILFLVFASACSNNEGVVKIGAVAANAPSGDSWSASLSGSVMDGALNLTADGHFSPDVHTRQRFDWALSATGEVEEDVLEQRLVAYVRASLVPPAQSEALDVLGRYLNYRRAGAQLEPAPDAASRLQEVIALRDQFFTPAVHAALFGAEEARAEVAVAQMAVQQSQASDADKLAARARIAEQLPAATKKAQAAERAPLAAYEQETALRAQGASAEAIEMFRVQTFGADAAARLHALDQDNAAFTQTLTTLKNQRAALLAQGASPEVMKAWLATQVAQAPLRDQRRLAALLSR